MDVKSGGIFRLFVTGALVGAGVSVIHAATFNVVDVPTLTSAINSANGNNSDDTIEMAAGTYTLTAALPRIGPDGPSGAGHKLTIHGNGATIDGGGHFRIFYNQSGANLTVTGLTLTNGNGGTGHAGAIMNDADTDSVTLTIVGCTFTQNTSADYGGAIFNNGYSEAASGNYTAVLTVTNSTFSNNSGAQYGGAIWTTSGAFNAGVSCTSVLNVNNCTFSANTATRSAGAIQHDGSGGSATGSINNCTFIQNIAGDYGGALDIDGQGGSDGNGDPTNGSAILSVTNCTFYQNSANWGGAIALDGSNGTGSTGNATLSVSNCTFSGNSATTLGGGVYLSITGAGTSSLQIGNTILKTGASGSNFAINGGGTITSQGYNLSNDAAGGPAGTAPGGLLNHTGDKRNTDPLLDPAGVKDNGGFTVTIALQATSPALDQGKRNTISSSNNDQRMEPRPFDDPNVTNAIGGDGSDIGAYEADVRTISERRVVNDLHFSFTTILGHNYEVQGQTSLNPGGWSTVNNTTPPPPIAGTGGIIEVTVPNAIGGPGQGFYRAHQLP